jgi:hypothetical protein
MKRKVLGGLVGLAVAVCAVFWGGPAYGLAITDPYVVGIVVSGEPSSIADEVVYVNTLLGLGANAGPIVIGGHTYTTGPVDYNGTVTALNAVQWESINVPSGYEYVLAKYDGPNGGDMVWYLGGMSMTLPSDSWPLWKNKPGNAGLGLSHFTVFNAVSTPDYGTTALLLGLGVFAIGFLRMRG